MPDRTAQLAVLHQAQALFPKRHALLVEKGQMRPEDATAAEAALSDAVETIAMLLAFEQPAIEAGLATVLPAMEPGAAWLKLRVDVTLAGRGPHTRDVLVRCTDWGVAELLRQGGAVLRAMAERGEVSDERAARIVGRLAA